MDLLSPKCLLRIFENIFITKNNNDYKTLLNCVFVNKQWSPLAISVLWRNPFEKISSINDNISVTSVITTYIGCFPQESKDSLITNGLEFPEEVLRQTLFDYPSHLQILNYQKLYNAITLWIENYLYKEESNGKTFHQNQLLDHTFRMLMNKCRKIYRIDISDVRVKIIHFPLLPNSDECLSNITEFCCNGKWHSYFLYILSQKCTQIKSFHLKKQDCNNEGLVRLLDVQKVPLESLNIDINNSSTLLIEDIIKKNVDSISKLKLTGFSRLFIIDCKNLKELEFDFDYGGLKKEFVKSKFPKLEKLNISITFFDLNNICDFLKNHSGIKYLYFKEIPLVIDENVERFTRKLIKYCPNLIEYGGPFYIDHIEINKNFLLKLFKGCLNLEKLRFWGENDSLEISEYLKISSKYIPKKLNTLHLDPYWEFNEEALDVFLNECKKRLTRKLDLEIPSSRKCHHIGIVLDKYARENVLNEEHIINPIEEEDEKSHDLL